MSLCAVRATYVQALQPVHLLWHRGLQDEAKVLVEIFGRVLLRRSDGVF